MRYKKPLIVLLMFVVFIAYCFALQALKPYMTLNLIIAILIALCSLYVVLTYHILEREILADLNE